MLTWLISAAETPAQQYLFPTTEAPRFERTHGFVFGTVWVAMLIVWCGVALPILETRLSKRHSTDGVGAGGRH